MEELIKYELFTTRILRSRIATANEEERLAKHSENPLWSWRPDKVPQVAKWALPEA
jgi:hypothetical protein